MAAILSKNYLDNYSGKKRHVSLTIKETNDSYTNNFLIDSSSDSSYSVNTNVDVEIEYLTDKKTSEIIDPITFAYEAVAGNSIPPRNLSIYQSTPTSKKSDLESYNFMKTV
ncbi:hypothetical protein FACS1894218_4330 [Bacilli bacterium]|nr:hypothetical protein FACS1894218_4330 [Bacilli bacterium]